MTEPKYEASPRTVRRWVAIWAVGLIGLAFGGMLWVVDAGQRAAVVSWSLLGAILLGFVFRAMPDSAERPLRPRRNTDASVREFLRTYPVYVFPALGGQFAKDAVPGDPSSAVEFAVFAAAASVGVGAVILAQTWWARRKRGAVDRPDDL